MIGFALLYALPPVGMAWLAALGIMEWADMIKSKRSLPRDSISILFVLMTLASIGAALSNYQLMYLLSTLMIIAYFGIYLYFLHHPDLLQLRQFVWMTIFGGIYLYFSDKVFRLFSNHTVVGQGFSLMTGHLLLGFTKQNRLYGSAYNPNYACYLLILALAFLLVELLRALRQRNYRLVALAVILLPVLSFAIYDTGSRAGFIIMLLLQLLFFLRLDRRLFFAVTAAAAMLSPLVFRVMPRSENTGVSFDDRLYIWKNSIHIFTEQPLFGTTSIGFPNQYFNLTGHAISHAHNLFLAIFDSSGAVVGLFFIGVISISGYYLFQYLRKENKHRYSANLFLFSLPTIIAYGIMDFTLSSPQVLIIVLALVAFWTRCMARMRMFRDVRSARREHVVIHISPEGQLGQRQQKKEASLIHSLPDQP